MTFVPMVLMSDEEVASYGGDPDAGFGALETARGRLPLVAMDVDARVAGIVAAIDVAQTYVNTTGVAIEATYIFPLPDRMAVQRFQMEVGGRLIQGVIDERGAARQGYDRAIAAGHRAAITEEERAGVFTLRVGNLVPGDVAKIRLSLVGPLAVDDGEVTFRFPLVVAPRYIPGGQLGGVQAGVGTAPDTDLVPDASRISPPVRLPGCPDPVRLGLRVALDEGQNPRLRDVTSSLHAVTVRTHDAQIIEVQPGERLDRDFILRWRIDAKELHSSLVCFDDAGGHQGTFALTVVPPSTAAVAAKPRDVVFVIDRSGSMEGWKMVAARRAAARMIDSLTSRDRFCAIAFDNTVELVPATSSYYGMVAATDRNRFRAVEALAKIEARGGTEIAQPLQRAIAMLTGGTTDRERVIVLVTDGQVGNEDHILREVAPSLRNIKMFTLGIDQAVNAAFLRRLAGAGGGLCELVESEDRLDAVMTKVHRRIGTPIATELALRATGSIGSGAGFALERDTLAPSKLPDVYAGAPIVIFGRYRGDAAPGAAIEITGTTLGDPFQVTVSASRSSAADRGSAAGWLAASWARARIRELEDRYAVRAGGDLEREIVELSKRYSVLSRFTAFLAVDRDQVVNPGGWVHPVAQPVEAPAGWAGAAPMRQTMVAGAPIGGPIPLGSPAPAAPSGNLAPGGMAPQYMPRGGMAPMSRTMAMPASKSEVASAVPSTTTASVARSRLAEPEMSQLEELASSVQDESRDAEDRKAVAPPPPPASSVAKKPAPPPALPAARMATPAPRKVAAPAEASIATSDDAYRATLATLAEQLTREARGACEASAIRLLRQRLVQWVEDVRSAGHVELARVVDVLVHRLSAALGAPAGLLDEATAIAGELTALAVRGPAGSGPTGPAASPSSPSRSTFWK